VISRKSGHLYEKRVLEKHLQEVGRCPVSGEQMEQGDVLSLAVSRSVRPRLSAGASVPGLLSSLQNEWDDIAMETFSLKQTLDATRRDLSQALYQHDAACRVIARLMRERDEARAALSNGQKTFGSPNIYANEQIDKSLEALGATLEEVDRLLEERMQVLTAARRGRKPNPRLATKEELSAFKTCKVVTPHKASPAGVTCMALSCSGDESGDAYLLTGGADKDALLLSKDGVVLSRLSGGHSGKISAVAFGGTSIPEKTPRVLYTASVDSKITLWTDVSRAGAFSASSSFSHHSGEVSALDQHPVDSLLASFSHDGTWALLDIPRRSVLRQIPTSQDSVLCGRIHVDGLLLGTGQASGIISIWDFREKAVVTCLSGNSQGVSSLDFSENGYHLASGDRSGEIKLWDLRKMASGAPVYSVKRKFLYSLFCSHHEYHSPHFTDAFSLHSWPTRHHQSCL